ncbi:MAG: ISL3 family transposase [Actinomycetota bacterium]|nr:ISL3 family transposase [Actinomycetota bacterium]
MRARLDPELVPEGLRTEHLVIDHGRVSIFVGSVAPSACCPACDRRSRRTHSRYWRTVSDLPWHGTPVTLKVRARRFFCDEASCERRVFCERLPDVAARARKTDRLERALLAIVLELGGRAGARLADELGLLVGRDALLSRAKRAAPARAGEVKILGVDDFAFRRGHAYGTVLVDLEKRRVVDLLPDRSQGSLAAWLRRHPEVEVATRDRSNIYREALAVGVPDAVQVTDRWHLLRNLALTLEEFLLQKRPMLSKAASPDAAPEDKGDDSFGSGPVMPNRPRKHDRKIEEAARKRHERLVEQWKDIRRLYLAGADLRHICRALGVSPRTVYRYKDLAEPPPRPAYKRRASVLDPYVPYLVRRWSEGCRNGKKLYREIREQGYANSEETCTHFVAQLRRADAKGKPPSSVPRARRGSVAGLSPSSKNVAALFMRREEMLNVEQKEYLGRLCGADAVLSDARRLTQEFAEMVRNLEGGKLDGWLEEAEACKAPAMRRFATGLKKNLAAVRAGLTEEWSNGPVEGFVNKLKLVKRQGYGRAGFELLRARMLAA